MALQKIVSSSILPSGFAFSAGNATAPLSNSDLKVFHHHIYEFKKGLRELILTTEKASNREYIEQRLLRENISYLINAVSNDKINVFFGSEVCIRVVAGFDSALNKLSPEEDFILGTMLGYGKLQQCERYLRMKKKNKL